MSKISRNIRCANCGVFTKDADYCTNCGNLISHSKKLALKKEAEFKERVQEVKHELENPNLAERLKKHRFWLFRIFGWILYSAILIVSAIGAFLAWFVAMVAAG